MVIIICHKYKGLAELYKMYNVKSVILMPVYLLPSPQFQCRCYSIIHICVCILCQPTAE